MNVDEISELQATLAGTGITLRWYDEQQIVAFQLESLSQATVDAWVESVKQLLRHWRREQPLLSLYDMGHNTEILTAYARHRAALLAAELEDLDTDLHGKVAVVIPPTAQARFMRVFIQTMILDGPRKFDFEIFNNIEAALLWLRKASKPTP